MLRVDVRLADRVARVEREEPTERSRVPLRPDDEQLIARQVDPWVASVGADVDLVGPRLPRRRRFARVEHPLRDRQVVGRHRLPGVAVRQLDPLDR